jgi:DNA-binding XRE family transcriptional regulator
LVKWEFLRDCRKKMGLTQSELATKIGVTKNTVYDWESGAYMPTNANNISALEEALQLKNGELYKQLYGNPIPSRETRAKTKAA